MTDLVDLLRARGSGDIADGYEDKAERGHLDLRAAHQIEKLRGLLREVVIADDSNVDTATTLPYDIVDRIKAALGNA